MSDINTGNINYSLNKNDFYKIIFGNTFYYIPHYFVLFLFYVLYLHLCIGGGGGGEALPGPLGRQGPQAVRSHHDHG